MLRLHNKQNQVKVDTERGGQIATWQVDDVELLFPDQQISTPTGEKRRGGIPILFPNAGPLPNHSIYPLKQHGFARDLAWNLISQTESSAILRLESSQETEVLFPYQWTLEEHIELSETDLNVQLIVENRSSLPMPLAMGLHPYFRLIQTEKERVEISLPTWDAKRYNWQDTLIFAQQKEVVITVPGVYKVSLQVNEPLQRWMVWSESERDHVCVEPWMGEDGDLLSKPVFIQPNEKVKLECTMRYLHL